METPKINQENKAEKEVYNPNSIGEVLSLSKDLLTFPDKVYRSVKSEAAIEDIEKSGVVRNAQSAGLVEKSRWGDRVFWSKGAEGSYHVVQKDGFVIEAPLSVAQERQVGRDDVTAVYRKNEEGEVENIWVTTADIKAKEAGESDEDLKKQREVQKAEDEKKIQEVRSKLGL